MTAPRKHSQKKHQVIFTDQMWEDLEFFKEVLGFVHVSQLVHAAVVDYLNDKTTLIQLAKEQVRQKRMNDVG